VQIPSYADELRKTRNAKTKRAPPKGSVLIGKRIRITPALWVEWFYDTNFYTATLNNSEIHFYGCASFQAFIYLEQLNG
jgi:hypothetical protein